MAGRIGEDRFGLIRTLLCSTISTRAEVTRLTLESLGYTTACNAGSWARYEASRGAKQ